MDVWVRSEYAGELAVLSAWVAALLPWSVSFVRALSGGLLVVRFPFVEVRYGIGLPLARAVEVVGPLSALRLQQGTASAAGYRLWVPGAAVFVIALALSVADYLRENRLEAGPVDLVRAMGVVFIVGLLVLDGASLLLFDDFPGATVPVGVLLTPILAFTLLVADRPIS